MATEGYFQSRINDVRIYNRVLTTEEIARLYWLCRWYYLNWWQRLLKMAKETWLILLNRENKSGFDFWWTPYNKIVYDKKRRRL